MFFSDENEHELPHKSVYFQKFVQFSVKVQIWCKLNSYSFTLGISFLYNFLCVKESGVTVWATTSYLISHMKNTFASATNSD